MSTKALDVTASRTGPLPVGDADLSKPQQATSAVTLPVESFCAMSRQLWAWMTVVGMMTAGAQQHASGR